MLTENEILSRHIGNNPGLLSTGRDQYFFGHGKLLLSGEYFVLDGADALALPTKLGQSLSVRYSSSFEPKLNWKSYDCHGKLWFEANFEFWRFNILDENPSDDMVELQKLLRQARSQNSHFLRDDIDVYVETVLDFPRDWGLGSSSTLIYNLAQWAYVSPFELLFKTQGGSGYDIACAQSEGPILYKKNSTGPQWSQTVFNPSFKEQLYFVHLGKKQNSRKAIEYYNKMRPYAPEVISTLSSITTDLVKCETLSEFEFLIRAHELFVSKTLDLVPAKTEYFSDYWGEVKSLGAWGGDFVLVTSHKDQSETMKYFEDKGFNVVIPYRELIMSGSQVDNSGVELGKTLH